MNDWLYLYLEVLKPGFVVREWNLVIDFLALTVCEYIQSHPLMASIISLTPYRTHLPLIPISNRVTLFFILAIWMKKCLIYWLPIVRR
jgi:hypothetical protein